MNVLDYEASKRKSVKGPSTASLLRKILISPLTPIVVILFLMVVVQLVAGIFTPISD